MTVQTRSSSKVGAYAILVIATLLALFPLYWTLLTSVRSRVDIFADPPRLLSFRFLWGNYSRVLNDQRFRDSLFATVTITTGGTVIATVLGTLAAYQLARRATFRGRRPFEAVLIIIRALPGIVLAVPLYELAIKLDLYDRPIAMMFVYAAINLPFSVWLMVGFIAGVPLELEEAARVDGAGELRTLWQIVLPIIRPGLAATTIFVSLLCWNEFLIPLVLADRTAQTLPVYVGGFVTSRTIDWGAMAAAASIAILPIAILTLLVQRQLVSGLSLGAVKD